MRNIWNISMFGIKSKGTRRSLMIPYLKGVSEAERERARENRRFALPYLNGVSEAERERAKENRRFALPYLTG